jgi:hypothetical protein
LDEFEVGGKLEELLLLEGILRLKKLELFNGSCDRVSTLRERGELEVLEVGDELEALDEELDGGGVLVELDGEDELEKLKAEDGLL